MRTESNFTPGWYILATAAASVFLLVMRHDRGMQPIAFNLHRDGIDAGEGLPCASKWLNLCIRTMSKAFISFPQAGSVAWWE